MIVTQLTTILVMFMMLTNGESNETVLETQRAEVWCPEHTRSFMSDTDHYYHHCEPYDLIFFNDDFSDVINYHPNNSMYGDVHPMDHFMSPSCHRWVRLHKDQHFQFDFNDGSIHEMKTDTIHQLGTYLYNPELKEAIICRDRLLPGDDNKDITLWCSSHLINTNGPPSIDRNGTLYVPLLNATLRKGFYKVHRDKCNKTNCPVEVCMNMSMEFLHCPTPLTPDYNGTPFQVLSNLSLLVKWNRKHELYPVGHYYLTSDHKSANVCVEEQVQSDDFADNVYPLYIVSAIFCFFTLLAHVFFPKLNYHAKALLCHVASMMVMYVCLTVRRFYPYADSVGGRFTLFVFYYVSSMSTYLWLSIIAYEVWKVFANLRGSSRVLETEREKKRWFAAKCGCAWGIPLVICFLVIGLAHNRKAADVFEIELVKYHATAFRTRLSVFLFMYGPAIVILLANMVFFGLTIWTIRQASTKTKSISKKVSRKLLYLSMKLFVVMGISWVADVISFGVGGSAAAPAFYMWHVINGLQGVAVFLVYVCKKSTWRMMRRKCGAVYVDPTSETKTSEFSRDRLTSTDGNLRDGDRNRKIPKAEVPLVTVTHE